MLNVRRYKNIVAFTEDNESFWALQSENLDFAEISKELWQQMVPVDYSSSEFVSHFSDESKSSSKQLDDQHKEAQTELLDWDAAQSDAPSLQDLTSTKNQNFNSNYPQTFTINISQICNLGCKYCVAGGDGTYGNPVKKIDVEKTIPQLEFFLKKIPKGKKARLTYLGGEPLLYPEVLFAIVDYVQTFADSNLITVDHSLITNGTLLTESIAKDLAKYNFDITVSIDGPAVENDELRPLKQKNSQETSTDKTIQGLNNLRPFKNQFREVTLHSVFSRHNQNLIEAYNFFRTLPADLYEFTLDIHTTDESLMWAYLKQMSAVFKLAFQLGGEEEIKKIHIVHKFFNTLDQKKKTFNYCGSGKSFISLDADNQVYACPLEVNNIKNSAGKGLKLQEDQLTGRSSSLIETNSCQTCWARYFCGGGCMYIHNHLTGSKHKKDKIFCIKIRHLLAEALMYYKQSRT
jgi:uncharacterized protein